METWQLILSALTGTGISAAIVGLVARRIERSINAKLTARETAAAEADKAREEMLCSLVQATWASIALGEATARAVQRIPDAHCNGDMHEALEYATKVKREQKAAMAKQGIHALW